MSLYITKDDVRNAFLLITTKNVEACGQLLPTKMGGEKLILFLEKFGESKMCDYTMSRYIWHTHPTDNLPYPSAQDIVQVFQHHKKDVFISVVFTRWGVWEISSDKVDFEPQDVRRDYFLTELTKNGDYLYFNSDKGKDKDPPLKEIDTYIKNVKLITELAFFKTKRVEIRFSPWDLTKPYMLKNRV